MNEYHEFDDELVMDEPFELIELNMVGVDESEVIAICEGVRIC